MKKQFYVVFFFFLIFLTLSVQVFARDYSLVKNPVNVCSSSGEILNYQINPFQDVNTSFVADKNQLVIFSRQLPADFKVYENGSLKNLSSVLSSSGQFYVGIYSVNLTPGLNVSITAGKCIYAGYEWDSRCIQGYLLQDSKNPIYNLSNLNILYDGHKLTSFIEKGNYTFLVFDKYTEDFPGKGNDTRYVNVVINSSQGKIFDKTFVQPNPSPAEGVVLSKFYVNESSNYTFSVEANDSVYWFNFSCVEKPIPPSPFCGDGVCNDGELCSTCSSDCGTCKYIESTSCSDCSTKKPVQMCLSNWECSQWSSCVDGFMTRKCTDINNCRTSYNKPTESSHCVQEVSPSLQQSNSQGISALEIGLILAIILLCILIGIVLYNLLG